MEQADRKKRLKEIQNEMKKEAKKIEALKKKWLDNASLVLAKEEEEKDEEIETLKKENASLSDEMQKLEATLSRLQLQNDREEDESGTNEEPNGWKAGVKINAETSIDVRCRNSIDEGLELTLRVTLDKKGKAYVTLGNLSVFFCGSKSEIYIYPD